MNYPTPEVEVIVATEDVITTSRELDSPGNEEF